MDHKDTRTSIPKQQKRRAAKAGRNWMLYKNSVNVFSYKRKSLCDGRGKGNAEWIELKMNFTLTSHWPAINYGVVVALQFFYTSNTALKYFTKIPRSTYKLAQKVRQNQLIIKTGINSKIPSLKLEFSSNFKFSCKRSTRILSVGIKYYMSDLIYDVINYSNSICFDVGKIKCIWRIRI